MSNFGPGRITSVNILNYAGTYPASGGPTGASFSIINNTTPTTTLITNTYSFVATSLIDFPVTPPLPVNLDDILTIKVDFPVTAAIPSSLRMRVLATITLP
jgi:hypothetical protein